MHSLGQNLELVAHPDRHRNGLDERVERVKWRREAERQARMITYLSLPMNLVLRDWQVESGRWKVEGYDELFDQGRSGGAVEVGLFSGNGGRSGTEFQHSWTGLETGHVCRASESAIAVASERGEVLS